MREPAILMELTTLFTIAIRIINPDILTSQLKMVKMFEYSDVKRLYK
jgi:hypothetical protein